MQVSYVEGLANHDGPESCLDDPRGRGEALTGEHASGLWSSEITKIRKRTWLPDGERNMGRRVEASGVLFRRSPRTWRAWKLTARKSGDLGKETVGE